MPRWHSYGACDCTAGSRGLAVNETHVEVGKLLALLRFYTFINSASIRIYMRPAWRTVIATDSYVFNSKRGGISDRKICYHDIVKTSLTPRGILNCDISLGMIKLLSVPLISFSLLSELLFKGPSLIFNLLCQSIPGQLIIPIIGVKGRQPSVKVITRLECCRCF